RPMRQACHPNTPPRCSPSSCSCRPGSVRRFRDCMAAATEAGRREGVTRHGRHSSLWAGEEIMTRQVLILGGGYGGVYAALGGARARGDAAVDITLVSAEPDLVNRPRLYESGPGEHIRYPLVPMLERIRVGFRLARVTGIDVEARRVALAE